jgi:hypothetical protein
VITAATTVVLVLAAIKWYREIRELVPLNGPRSVDFGTEGAGHASSAGPDPAAPAAG